MKNCVICKSEIEIRTKSVSVVGGLFPAEDPDFFMIDESIMKESYVHLECFLKALTAQEGSSS